MRNKLLLTLFILGFQTLAFSQKRSQFAQMNDVFPTPNNFRTASGAPGKEYWQIRADYQIKVSLDEPNRVIKGSEWITFHNNSPDALNYLWIQLDQNIYKKESISNNMRSQSIGERMDIDEAMKLTGAKAWEGGYTLSAVKDKSGNPLKCFINGTMMRIELPQTLNSGSSYTFNIDWSYPINDARKVGGRTGFEYFEKDDNCIFELAHWFPRCAVYTDYTGWQHKQFLGSGEFTLPFGDYEVAITVPADHIVGATGELSNTNSVLNATQIERFNKAKKANKPVIIVTQAEAEKAEKQKSTATKTWVYKAKNVRDFAWASSRKFIWDAMNQPVGNKQVLAMSYYPKEGNPLWEKYSTEAVAHTVKVYSKHTIDYPYPVAISVNGPIGGMEYPMICFNGPRPQPDGTYSERTKYGLISVVIHEVGHNFFPMIINSDERQWTWMDEGLNTFVQYLAEKAWDKNYPSSRGPARQIVEYMRGEQAGLDPIMTNSESIKQFGNNAYGKPATGLNILRETIMGRELFDYAFKTYCTRWAFKHPEPADFFRTMEDASAVDLDWFWNGWFYTTKAVDLSLENVTAFQVNTLNPEIENPKEKARRNAYKDVGFERNPTEGTRIEERPELKDFYNNYDPLQITNAAKKKFQSYMDGLNKEQQQFLQSNPWFYQLEFKNIGEFPMPIIIEIEYEDGKKEMKRWPVESWVKNEEKTNKVLFSTQPIKRIVLDPYQETADIDLNNNKWPKQAEPTRFQLFKNKPFTPEKNPMQIQRDGDNN